MVDAQSVSRRHGRGSNCTVHFGIHRHETTTQDELVDLTSYVVEPQARHQVALGRRCGRIYALRAFEGGSSVLE